MIQVSRFCLHIQYITLCTLLSMCIEAYIYCLDICFVVNFLALFFGYSTRSYNLNVWERVGTLLKCGVARQPVNLK